MGSENGRIGCGIDRRGDAEHFLRQPHRLGTRLAAIDPVLQLHLLTTTPDAFDEETIERALDAIVPEIAAQLPETFWSVWGERVLGSQDRSHRAWAAAVATMAPTPTEALDREGARRLRAASAAELPPLVRALATCGGVESARALLALPPSKLADVPDRDRTEVLRRGGIDAGGVALVEDDGAGGVSIVAEARKQESA